MAQPCASKNTLLPHLLSVARPTLDPFRTAVPFWGQTCHIPSSLSPKRNSKRVGLQPHQHENVPLVLRAQSVPGLTSVPCALSARGADVAEKKR